jgi:hypothetical protein
MGRQITVRGVSDHVADRLEKLSRIRRRSVNSIVNEILEDAVGEGARRRRLERYATWTEHDVVEFDVALASQRTVDDEIWR